MASEKLSIILELITGGYKREAREAANATKQIGESAQSSTVGVGRLNSGMLKLGAALGAAGIAKFAADSVKAASNLEESINAVNVVFGEAADKIHAFGEISVDSVGLAAVNVNASATVLGSALINAGFAAEEAADKTIELTTRAADMASVFNTEVPEALGAIQSALRGETDPIEKFGVSLTAAAVEAEAAALGFVKVAGEFDSTAKAAARLSLIMKQTDRVSGDFVNTADSAANTMKRLKERFIEIQGRIGQALMPAFRSLLDVAQDVAPAFEDIATEIAGTVSELAPLISGLGELVSWTGGAKTATDDWSESENIFTQALGQARDLLEGMINPIKAYHNVVEILNTPQKEINQNISAFADVAEFMAEATKDDLIPAIEAVTSVAAPARDRLRELTDAYTGLTDAMTAAANPIFNAVTAMQALADVKADPKATVFELAEAVFRAQSALTVLGNGNVEAGIGLIAEATGRTNDEIRTQLDLLGILDGTEVTVLIGFDAEPFPLSFIEEQAYAATARVNAIFASYGLPTIVSPFADAGGFSASTLAAAAAAANNNLIGGLQEFAGGGVVQGVGPQLIIAHGGEIVSKPGQSVTNNKTGPTIIVNNPVPNTLVRDLQLASLLSNLETLAS